MADTKQNFFQRLFSSKKEVTSEVAIIPETQMKADPKAVGFMGDSRTLFVYSFDGEKNLGGIGPIKDYRMNHEALRLRSWQAYMDSDIAQTVIKRFCTWMIGGGLKLQCEPPATIFKEEGIELPIQEFSRSVEARFKLFRNAKWADFASMENLDAIAFTAFKNAHVGGDVLVVLRYEKETGNANIQLIDGTHICSPNGVSDVFPTKLGNGNTIRYGIEMSPTGKHIRYYVKNRLIEFEPIEAFSSESGLQMAFLVYGSKYKLNTVRGIPLLTTVLESVKKMERYKDATLESAEERAKIAFTIEHGVNSDGEHPMVRQMSQAFNADLQQDDLARDINGTELTDKVIASTNKEVINMPRDSKLVMHESKTELYFKEFFSVSVAHLCAALGIPVQVAMSQYEGNFSASRAALKDWENTLIVGRKSFADQFYVPIYNFWLDIMILKGKINAPGYLMARKKRDIELLEAYRSCRFIGAAVPHIDPKKEVEAERLKLGTLAAHIPLTTVEAATEAISESESASNLIQFAEEIEEASELGLEAVAVPSTQPLTEDQIKEKAKEALKEEND